MTKNNKIINKAVTKAVKKVTKKKNAGKRILAEAKLFSKALNPYNGVPRRLGQNRAIKSSDFTRNWNKQQYEYYANLMDPWNARDARLPARIDTYSKTAKPKTTFKINTNTAGNLMVYFDPDYVANPSSLSTAFFYCNNSALDGATAIPPTALDFNTGPVSSVPLPPASIVYKYRLVSAGIKATPKLSALNNVGTVIKCVDYGDYAPMTPGLMNVATSTSVATYTVFQNALQGTGGKKFDLIGESVSVCSIWFPADPAQSIYIDAGDFLVDNVGHEAGGSPKLVMCFEALNGGALTSIEFEIVWNIEYLAPPQTQPWLGAGGQGPKATEAAEVHNHLTMADFPSAKTKENLAYDKDFERMMHDLTDKSGIKIPNKVMLEA